MYHFKRYSVLVLYFVLSALWQTAPAQSNSEAFETFQLGFTTTANVNTNMFHDYWEQDYAIGLRFKTPFYFGDIEIMADLFTYKGVGTSTLDELDGRSPDFSNIFVAVGWGKGFNLTPNIEFFGGFFLGNSYLSFEQHTFFGKGESEVTAGLYAKGSYHISDSWLIHLTASQMRMFTFHRIDLSHITFGVS